LEPSHNARFHALMDKYFPRWREARKETYRICRLEEDEKDE
jgi:predicted metal-dependent hydrolase